jgi:hypothetical protein
MERLEKRNYEPDMRGMLSRRTAQSLIRFRNDRGGTVMLLIPKWKR